MAPASNSIRRTYAVNNTNDVLNPTGAMLFLVQPIQQFHTVNLINGQDSQPLHINGSAMVQHAPPSPNGRNVTQPLQSNGDGMVQHAPRRPRGKRYSLTFNIVSQKFHIPVAKAAKEFGLSTATLQLRCRELGFDKWPYPKIKCLVNLTKNVLAVRFPGFQNVLEDIKDEIESIKRNPSLDIKASTNVLRQRMYELKRNKRRRIED